MIGTSDQSCWLAKACQTLLLLLVHMQHQLLTLYLIAEAIDVPWGVPASFNASGVGSVTAVDHNTSRYRDVAAVVGDTITIHWNHTAGGNYSLWQIPSGWCCPAQLSCAVLMP